MYIYIPYTSKPRRNWVRWHKQRSLLKQLALLAWVAIVEFQERQALGLTNLPSCLNQTTQLQQQSNSCLVWPPSASAPPAIFQRFRFLASLFKRCILRCIDKRRYLLYFSIDRSKFFLSLRWATPEPKGKVESAEGIRFRIMSRDTFEPSHCILLTERMVVSRVQSLISDCRWCSDSLNAQDASESRRVRASFIWWWKALALRSI